ncbi:hypothetical protein SAMN04488128_1021208 [Chitinophaga eiseniae]|uniref:Uncharacterized protein n=1 Tax=Chitinophaga eiseniae TaxID=634771 RepID=A0A1T4RJZ2_9BACT|nr:hypothetical protein SAMN04488128_1021208 [Chitinophaga eiseniae]
MFHVEHFCILKETVDRTFSLSKFLLFKAFCRGRLGFITNKEICL